MRVLAFGTYDANAHPRVAVLLDGLRANGHDVVECNDPLGLTTAERVATLRQPWRLPRLAWRITSRWARLARRARRLGQPDVVVVGFLGHFDVLLARRLFRRTPIVLDHLISAAETALDRGATSRLALGLLRRLDLLAVRSADLVVVDTEERSAIRVASGRPAVIVVPVGATDAWFAARRTPIGAGAPSSQPLRVVFFGLYTPLQGAPVVGAAIGLLADDPIEITMIGNGQDFDATRRAAGARAKVSWMPWVDAQRLPAVVASHDVCLGIFGTSPKSATVVPNKVFQGMAAGLAVVTSDSPPQRRALGDAAVLIRPGDPVALADALRGLAGDRPRLSATQTRAGLLADRTMTAQAVTAGLAKRLSSLPDARAIG